MVGGGVELLLRNLIIREDREACSMAANNPPPSTTPFQSKQNLLSNSAKVKALVAGRKKGPRGRGLEAPPVASLPPPGAVRTADTPIVATTVTKNFAKTPTNSLNTPDDFSDFNKVAQAGQLINTTYSLINNNNNNNNINNKVAMVVSNNSNNNKVKSFNSADNEAATTTAEGNNTNTSREESNNNNIIIINNENNNKNDKSKETDDDDEDNEEDEDEDVYDKEGGDKSNEISYPLSKTFKNLTDIAAKGKEAKVTTRKSSREGRIKYSDDDNNNDESGHDDNDDNDDNTPMVKRLRKRSSGSVADSSGESWRRMRGGKKRKASDDKWLPEEEEVKTRVNYANRGGKSPKGSSGDHFVLKPSVHFYFSISKQKTRVGRLSVINKVFHRI